MLTTLALILALVSPVHGTASWYDDGPGLYAAAGPALRVGDWRNSRVEVCAETCVVVRLVDWCACYKGTARERVIDLSPDAFRRLAPLSRGLVRVTVRPVRAPSQQMIRQRYALTSAGGRRIL